METRDFLMAIQKELSGQIVDEAEVMLSTARRPNNGMDETLASEPHINITHRGLVTKIDFIIRQDLKFRVYAPRPLTSQSGHAFLDLRPSSIVDRLLGRLGILWAARTGDPELDETYFLTNLSQEMADQIFSPGVREGLRRLNPFAEFSLNDQGYSLLKGVDIDGGYRPATAIRGFYLFIDPVGLIRPRE